MKHILLLSSILVLCLSTKAQDTLTMPPFPLRPHIENGINFIRNDNLKELYNTQSTYYLGVGLQFGHISTAKLIPYVQYTHSLFKVETEIATNTMDSNHLKNQQYIVGFMVPVKRINSTFVRAKAAYSYSTIEESFNSISTGSNGFQIGIGVEHKILKNSRLYIDLTYNYQKTSIAEFRDFDATKLSVGFTL